MKKKSILFSSTATYFTMLMIFVLIRFLLSLITLPFSEEVNDLIFTIIVQVGVMFCISVFMFSSLSKQKPSFTLREFGYKKIGLVPILLCIVIGAVCYVLNVFVASFFSTIISLMGYETAPTLSTGASADYSLPAFFLQVFLVAILPAIGEETAHRGLLLKGMSSMGIIKALLFSSLFFGLMHLNINQFFYATVLGFIMGLAVLMSKNIFPGIIIHFMNNFLSTYFTFASQKQNLWPFYNLPDIFSAYVFGDGNVFSLFIRSLIFLAIIFSILVFLFVRLLRHTRVKNVENMLKDISDINNEFNSNPNAYSEDDSVQNLYNLNKLMGEYNIKSVGQMVFTDLESRYKKPSMFERVCLISCLVVGVLLTISTFVWGLL